MHDHHHHGHAHDHGPTRADPRRALLFSLGLNAGFLVVEAVAGWWTGSLALLSDAAHMASDVGALVLALAATQLARRPATARMTFGLQRTETLGAFVNSLALLVIAGLIVMEGLARFESGPPPVAGLPVLVVGGVGLIINLGSAWSLFQSDRHNLNIRAAMVHMMADALGSAGAVVAALLLMRGYHVADTVVSILIAGLVVASSFGILRDSGRILLQLPPRGLDVTSIRARLTRLEGVSAVHDLHAWSLDGRDPIVTAHLVAVSGADRDHIRANALAALSRDFHITHATLQMEQDLDPCLNVDCGAPEDAATEEAPRKVDHGAH